MPPHRRVLLALQPCVCFLFKTGERNLELTAVAVGFVDTQRRFMGSSLCFFFFSDNPLWLFMALRGYTSLWEVGISLVEGPQLSEISGDYVVFFEIMQTLRRGRHRK